MCILIFSHTSLPCYHISLRPDSYGIMAVVVQSFLAREEVTYDLDLFEHLDLCDQALYWKIR